MATVNTQQSPDLLTSLLVGMGSSSSPSAAKAESTSQFGFAELLDPVAEAEQPTGDFTLTDEELSSELGSDELAADGQLNALLAASFGSAGKTSLDAASGSSVMTSESSDVGGSTGLNPGLASSASQPAPNSLTSAGFVGANTNHDGAAGALSSTANPMQKSMRESEQTTQDSDMATGSFASAANTSEATVETPSSANTGKEQPNGLQRGAMNTSTRDLSQEQELSPTTTRSTGEPLAATPSRSPGEGVTDQGGDTISENQFSSAESAAAELESLQAGAAQPMAVSVEPSGERVKGPGRNSDLSRPERLQGDDLGADFLSNGNVESAQAVTAMSAGGMLQQEGGFQHSFKQELVETATNRPANKLSAEVPTPTGWNSPELNDIQASFDTALEQAAETFPLGSIAQQIVEVAEPDSGWISLEIQPPELGKLEIMVSKQGDDYSARIIAHEASTGEALQLQQADLIEALGQHGLELKDVQITTDSGSSGNSTSDNAQRDFGGRRERENAEHQARENQRETFLNSRAKAMNRSAPKSSLPENVQVNLLV